MSEFKKYPSIGKVTDIKKHFSRGVFSHVDIDEEGNKTPVFMKSPTLKFRGTVKLHGTNAAVVLNSDMSVDAQSRSRILSLTSDNHGFCSWLSTKQTYFLDKYKCVLEDLDTFSLHIYGEWCGANIQSNVGLMGIDKTFVIFGILKTDMQGNESWLSEEDITYLSLPEEGIRNIFEFPTYEVDISSECLGESLKTIDELRDIIDQNCPVAEMLGSRSECKHGEGVVWRCITEGYKTLAFKHKGTSHERSGVKIKKTAVSEDLTELQKIKVEEFLEKSCSTDRLAQGLEYLEEVGEPIHQKSTGIYLRWVLMDVQKECKDEICDLTKSNVPWTYLSKEISKVSKTFLFKTLEAL